MFEKGRSSMRDERQHIDWYLRAVTVVIVTAGVVLAIEWFQIDWRIAALTVAVTLLVAFLPDKRDWS